MSRKALWLLPALALAAGCGTASASPPPWAHKPRPTLTPSPTVSPTPAPTTVLPTTPVATSDPTTPPPTIEPPPTTPAPTTTAPPVDPQPVGPPGTWSLTFRDEFDGTALDTAKWSPNWFGEGGSMNNVGTYAANVSESGGLLRLQLSTINGVVTGALVHTDYSAGRYQLPVGSYAEARVSFPGTTGQDIYNWPAWWASGPSWPSAGEHDIAEGLGGDLTINYHSPSINQQYPVSLTCCWGNAFHTFGVYRGAGFADVYWDGALQARYTTADNGAGEELILNVGKSNSRTPVLDDAGAVLIDYVRAWNPPA